MSNDTLQVQQLYERHPYPHYPLLAKPRWQDGYLGSSLFARHMIFKTSFDPSKPAHFLSIGCGEILPYIIRQWEPSSTKVDCVDLSKRSLRRAQFRTSLLGRQISFYPTDINTFLEAAFHRSDLRYDHVEAFGVLHHISSFQKTLSLIQSKMAPTGICRLMVYNARARDWIWDINRGFALLKLRFDSDADVDTARKLLYQLATFSPRLNERLRQMGRSSLESKTRFADTFLHPWEARADIHQWFAAFEKSGLHPVALYDRYAELDDLENPLWRCPNAEQLSERAHDLRYEDNLEIWLIKKDCLDLQRTGLFETSTRGHLPLRLRMRMPPSQLNQFEETRGLPFGVKLAIWQGFIKSLYGQRDRTSERLWKGLAPDAMKRLARIGLILPETAEMLDIHQSLVKPIHESMNPPSIADRLAPNDKNKIMEIIEKIHQPQKCQRQALRRFIRAM